MPVPSSMADLSTTAASNYPTGSDSPTSGDDYFRSIQAIIRSTNAKGADIASTTTTNIGAATGEFVDVTGTTTITGLGTIAAGIVRTVRFTGALTLTHNATSLILPGGTNITTANGDVAQFRSLGSGNWNCVGYIKADGTSVVIADSSITTAKIAGSAVTNAKLAFDGGALGNRNKIINGGMQIDQRNSGAAQTITAAAALAYTVDRWYAYCTGANVTGQRVAGSSQTKLRYRFTGAASVTKIGFAQRIESANCYDLNNGTATLSVDLANSLLTTVTWTAWYANTDNTFGTLASPTRTQIATGTFTVSSTVARYSTNITIPSAATTGIEIEFSVAAQTSGTWTIGNVQLEAGSVATPFENRSYGKELALCQMYFQNIGQGNAAFNRIGYHVAGGSDAVTYVIQPMRTAPTVSGEAIFSLVNCTAPAIVARNNNCIDFTTTITAAGSFQYNQSSGLILLSAEL